MNYIRTGSRFLAVIAISVLAFCLRSDEAYSMISSKTEYRNRKRTQEMYERSQREWNSQREYLKKMDEINARTRAAFSDNDDDDDNGGGYTYGRHEICMAAARRATSVNTGFKWETLYIEVGNDISMTSGPYSVASYRTGGGANRIDIYYPSDFIVNGEEIREVGFIDPVLTLSGAPYDIFVNVCRGLMTEAEFNSMKAQMLKLDEMMIDLDGKGGLSSGQVVKYESGSVRRDSNGYYEYTYNIWCSGLNEYLKIVYADYSGGTAVWLSVGE